ncbi:dockerin type I domain-containing protein [Ruegeria arenilitoris]|uniref:dockerin type I domain-containing protein n=1 Tax=Ruegeria arenilitoris TaxID=1173585 RepID=UPI0020C53EF8|nr:dockerin type I domain-containing protein [Ruegeria arenilitoris]
MLQFERVVATGSPALDSGIGDTALKTFNGVTYLYSTTRAGGGIVVWQLVDGGAPQFHDDQYFSGTISLQVGSLGALVALGASDLLALDVDTATGLVGYALNTDGTIGALQETAAISGGGDVTALVQYSVGAVDYLTVAHQDNGLIGTYVVNSNGSLSHVGSVAGNAGAMQTAAVGSNQYVVTANAVDNAIRVFSADQGSGTLIEVDNTTTQTLGISSPTALETVDAYGHTWVLVAGSSSNSISVMELRADGTLIPKDHALDTLGTRFGAVQDMKVVEVDGRVFVVAGGGDDGVTLLTMTPEGKLVYLDSFADTLDSGLQNVETIEVADVGDDLQIFVASQQDAGLTQMTVSLDSLGNVIEGNGIVTGTAQDDMLSAGVLDTDLQGGAGDDILIAGRSETTMQGGSGADIFVMRFGSGLTTITDFEAGTDRLDLFDYPMLHNPGQLTVTSTAQGARIEFMDETVELFSADGGTLTSAEIFGSGFKGPDHIPVDFGVLTGPEASAGVTGPITVESSGSNPALSDAEIVFTPVGNSPISVHADDQGQFDLDLPSGSLPGHVDIIKSYSHASGEITALDALQVLRIAVGLGPTWGPAAPENLIAADITQDGTVNAMDALAILQVAVGLPTAHEPEWVYLDQNADLSSITPTNVDYQTGAAVTALDGMFSVDMTSILLGNLEAV